MKDNEIPMPTQQNRREPLGPQLLKNSRAQLGVVFDENVPILASALGSPAFILEEAHSHGTKVWGLVGLPRQARRQIEAGMDVVIAQGYDAGGHSSAVGTFTLVPEVVQMAEGTNTLVLAAGGVSSGRHVAAAIAMGAEGVWTGTIWLATHESATEMFLKQRLIEAGAEDALQTRASSGKPMRQLRSKWSETWNAPGAPAPLQMPLQPMLVADIEAGIREARMEDWMYTPAGQSVVGIHSIRPAAEVVYSMVEEAQDQLDRMFGVPVA
jgi:NAD(P)H-dependent flavin oxidoreductase YrpB (nitropropane dioxygenase family)